jgi:hypothetical protein
MKIKLITQNMNKLVNSCIRLILSLAIFCYFCVPARCQTTNANVRNVSAFGWTITADPESGNIMISHDSLGVLLREIILNRKTSDGLKPIMEWSAEQKGDNLIAVSTLHPASAWTFELCRNYLVVSATTADLCLTAKAPASVERVVARLIDHEGVPVNWRGTDEVTNSWNGKDTQNPSCLPLDNPEVMTFALGQVSATNLHCMFDRRKDIAISFSDNTLMKRNVLDENLLDLTIPVPGKTVIRLTPDYYTKTLGLPHYSRFDDSVFPTAPLIWGSWTAYYYEAKESDIVRNTDWLAANLKPYGFQYVQLDDGYDRGKDEGHYWIENWNKTLFPHGPEWLANYIKSMGMHPGLWLVPNSYAGFLSQHPDWYLYDKSGRIIKDYNTPALDHTNPAVQEWLKKLFSTLNGWGFEYYKFDGELSLPAYVPDLDTSRLFDKSVNPLVAYKNRLKLIRDVIGPDTFVEGCVAGSPLNGIGFFNSCFNGADMYNSWKGSYAVFSSINANAFLNHIVMYVMPGEGIDVSPLMTPDEARQKMAPRAIEVALTREDPFTGFGTSLAEARTLVSVIALTGVAYPLTSVMPGLPDERVSLLKKTMPTLPILPVDLYSRGSDITWDKFKFITPDTYIHDYPEIIDLKVNAASGLYDVAAFTNWRGEKISKSVSFTDKLGIPGGNRFIVFDFWNQKLEGVYPDKIQVEIEPHDTRVFLIHQWQGHPQLIGNSRHISGAQSISDLKWNNDKKILSGRSETVKNDPYALFVYVPDGQALKKATVLNMDNKEMNVKTESSGNLLKINLDGHSGLIAWQLQFAAPARP